MILRTAAILLISAAIGPQLLQRLGISLDVFQIVGGVVITTIGYGMFAPGTAPASTDEQAAAAGILLPRSDCAVRRQPRHDLHGSGALGDAWTWSGPAYIHRGRCDRPGDHRAVMVVMVLRPGSSAGRNSSLISRFLGLILIAMGLQFVLTNLRAFFQAAG